MGKKTFLGAAMAGIGAAGCAAAVFGPDWLPEHGASSVFFGSMAVLGALAGLFVLCCWPGQDARDDGRD